MTAIHAVIFDMDGLMLDTEKIYFNVNHLVAKELGFDFTKDFYRQFIGSDNRHYEEGVFALLQNDELAKEFLEISYARLDKEFREGHVDLHEGLIELLEQLKEWEIPAVVASSTHREMVDHLLTKLKIRDYFIGVVGGDEVHYAKPDPAIFNKAASLFNVDKEEMIVLEDSLNGIRAAYAAGIRGIMVPDLVIPNEEAKEKSFKIVDNLTEVIDVIKECNS